MADEKSDGVLERNAHKFALGGQAVAAISILLLVPFVRRLREQRREQRQHRRFPILGH
jgi:hypothetical protein